MAKEIHVTIKETGALEIEGKGFVGLACNKATAFLEKALGKLGKRKVKKERWISNVKQGQK